MGTKQHFDGRDRRPHVQCRGIYGNHANALEASQRPREELAARLQSPGAARVPNQDWN